MPNRRQARVANHGARVNRAADRPGVVRVAGSQRRQEVDGLGAQQPVGPEVVGDEAREQAVGLHAVIALEGAHRPVQAGTMVA